MLHTLHRSPYHHDDLSSCLVAAKAGDAILFYQDAVIALQEGSDLQHDIQSILDKQIELYALDEDCLARSIDVKHQHIKRIDYAEFVVLTEQHETMCAW